MIHEKEKVYQSTLQDDGNVNAGDIDFLDATNDEWCEMKTQVKNEMSRQNNSAAVQTNEVWRKP